MEWLVSGPVDVDDLEVREADLDQLQVREGEGASAEDWRPLSDVVADALSCSLADKVASVACQLVDLLPRLLFCQPGLLAEKDVRLLQHRISPHIFDVAPQ